ncbi:MAG: cbb3-type cytochrome c oxidase subunit 3 [Bacteroidia bacterium]|nr:cbb3-type cytochrome c oxidase subunit 3 [Bacteroidia bacterium]
MKEVLRSIEDVSLFPVISILIFFTFFVVLLIYVFRLKKNEVADMASIPLREDVEGCETKQMLVNQAKSLN